MTTHTLLSEARISAIIPAFDEEETIANVVQTVMEHPWITEVIVVSDGSTDETAANARAAGARVIELTENAGKGKAMDIGVRNAKYDILLFLDADLHGLTIPHISELLWPIMRGKLDMHTIVRERKIESFEVISELILLSGQRALTREVWNLVPEKEKEGFGIEIALNYFAKKNNKRIATMYATGITQDVKEKKHGLLRGLWERGKLCGMCTKSYLKLYIFNAPSEFSPA